MNVTGKPNSSSLIHRRLLGCFAGLGERKDKIVGTTAEPRSSSRHTLAGDSENRLRVDGNDVNFGERRCGEVRRIHIPRTRVNKGKKALKCSVNKSLHYSSDLENSSKASRAFEVFSRSGPRSPHAKHRTKR
jgi:hypothetical protein